MNTGKRNFPHREAGVRHSGQRRVKLTSLLQSKTSPSLILLELQSPGVVPLDWTLAISLRVTLEPLLKQICQPVQKLLQSHAARRDLAGTLGRRGSGIGWRGRSRSLIATRQSSWSCVGWQSARWQDGGQVGHVGRQDWVDAG